MKLLGLSCALATIVAVAAHAEDNWGDLAVVSGTMGTNAGRLCMGEGSRVGDIGCPTYGPYVSSTGNMGVGTNNPSKTLTVSGTTYTGRLQLQGISASAPASYQGGLWSASGTAVTYSGGNVGVGTTSPQISLHVAAASDMRQLRLERTGTSTGISADLGGSGGNLYIYPGGYAASNGNVIFNTTGNIGIGTTAPGRQLTVAGATGIMRLQDNDNTDRSGAVAYLEFSTSDASRIGYVGDGVPGSANMYIVADAGSVVALAGANSCTYSSGSSWSCSSDKRLKKNIQPVEHSLGRLSSLHGVTFQWKDKRHPGVHYGLIAQDVEAVYPEMVSEDERGFKSIDYSAFVAPLIEAVKELKAENDTLRARLDALEKRAN
jgi:hypothetical protein